MIKPHTAFCSAEVLVNSPASLVMHTMSGWGSCCVCDCFWLSYHFRDKTALTIPKMSEKNLFSVALNCLEERGVMGLRPGWIWTCSSWNMSNHLAMTPTFLSVHLTYNPYLGWHILPPTFFKMNIVNIL